MDDKKTVIFEIVPMTQEHIRDINEPNQPFIVFGRLIPSFPTEDLDGRNLKTTYENSTPMTETTAANTWIIR